MVSDRDSGRHWGWPVSPRFWCDELSTRWDDDTKLLALYLLTCPHRTLEGIFRLPKGYILADLQWSPERLAKPFRQLLDDRFIDYDETAAVILIRQALKYNRPVNPNMVKAGLARIEELPETPLLWEFQQLAERFCQPLAERLAERFAKHHNHNHNRNHNQEPGPPNGGVPISDGPPNRSTNRCPQDQAASPRPPLVQPPVTDHDSDDQHQEIDPSEDRQEPTDKAVTEQVAAPRDRDTSPDDVSPEVVARIWNERCGDVLPMVQRLTERRRRHIRARIRAEKGRNESWWHSYFSRIRASPWLCGENDRGWRADFEWAIRSEDVVAKVLEGRYDPRARDRPLPRAYASLQAWVQAGREEETDDEGSGS